MSPAKHHLVDAPLDLGNNIYHYEPKTSPTHDDNHSRVPLTAEAYAGTSPPKLSILCTWLDGATTPRVKKYVDGYRARFRTAHLLLIGTVFLDISVRTFGALRAQLQPARDAISRIMGQQRNHSEPQQQPAGPDDILLHIFSHGGCNRALQLA